MVGRLKVHGPARAAALGAQALVYGYPLTEFLRVRREMTSVACPDVYGNAPVNSISNVGGLARPEDRVVVAPNVDTLYSISHLDLGDGPVILSHPDMGARYFSFQLLDPYTNTLDYIGSRTTGPQAGRFAIGWDKGPKAEIGDAQPLVVTDRRIWVIGRTMANGPADQAVAQALMGQYSVVPTGGGCSCESSSQQQVVAAEGLEYLDTLSAAMEENPPPARDAEILRRLAGIGVGPGLRIADARLGRATRVVLDRAVRATAAALPAGATAKQYASAISGGGWARAPDHIGDYGTDYVFRAGVAEIGLGANTREEAAYQTALLDARRMPLKGSNRYRLRFAAGVEPPANAFWSVTVYDSEGFLVPGQEGRHAIGSHHDRLVRQEDGSIDIVFSQQQPSEHRINWLGVPAGGFRVYLRIYEPQAPVLDGRWIAPGIEKLR